METEYTIEDMAGDTISFKIYDGTDTVEISIPFNAESMYPDTALVALDKQDIARLATKLDLPEVTNE